MKYELPVIEIAISLGQLSTFVDEVATYSN